MKKLLIESVLAFALLAALLSAAFADPKLISTVEELKAYDGSYDCILAPGVYDVGEWKCFEFVDIDKTFDGNGAIIQGTFPEGFVHNNGGTIKNTVFRYSDDFALREEVSTGGLCLENNGVITDCCFCGRKPDPANPGAYIIPTVTLNSIRASLICGSNYGRIMNICLYNVRINFGPQAAVSGGVCGHEGRGSISNCWLAPEIGEKSGRDYGAYCGSYNDRCTNIYFSSDLLDQPVVFSLTGRDACITLGFTSVSPEDIRSEEFRWILSRNGGSWYPDFDGYPIPLAIKIAGRLDAPAVKTVADVTLKGNPFPIALGLGSIFKFDDFALVPKEDYKNCKLEITDILINGSRMNKQAEYNTSDYPNGITFSVSVVNKSVERLRISAARHRELYEAARGYYTSDSLALYNAAITKAENRIRDYPLATDADTCLELMGEMEDACYNLVPQSFLVTLLSEGCQVMVEDSPAGSFSGKAGDKVTLTAVPSAGEGTHSYIWTNSFGNVLGTGDTLEYTISGATDVKVVCISSAFTLTFRDSLGKVYRVLDSSDYDKVPYPYAVGSKGMRVGYQVTGWTNDYGKELPSDISRITKNVTFTAQLKRNEEQTYKVALYRNGTPVGNPEYLRVGRFFCKTADETFGNMHFACWRSADTDRVISYSRELCIPVYSDMNITAVYTDEGRPAEVPTVMNIQKPVCDADNEKISFVCQLQPGSDFDSDNEICHGAILLKSESPVTELTAETPGAVIKVSGGLSKTANAYIINAPSPKPGETWYACAYCMYVDENGIVRTVYSGIEGGSLPLMNGPKPRKRRDPETKPEPGRSDIRRR